MNLATTWIRESVSSTDCDSLELRNDALRVGNMEGLGVPVRGEQSTGVIKESESLVTAVSHFRDNLEVVNVCDSILASERNRDARSSEDCRATSE
jgi:hypothetical protein